MLCNYRGDSPIMCTGDTPIPEHPGILRNLQVVLEFCFPQCARVHTHTHAHTMEARGKIKENPLLNTVTVSLILFPLRKGDEEGGLAVPFHL